MSYYNKDEISHAARGQWKCVLTQLFGVDSRLLSGKHCECPSCGGKDRFRFDDKDGTGSYYCNGCGAGDGLSLAVKVHGDFYGAVKAIAREFRVDGSIKPVSMTERISSARASNARLDLSSVEFMNILAEERNAVLELSVIASNNISGRRDMMYAVNTIDKWKDTITKTHHGKMIAILVNECILKLKTVKDNKEIGSDDSNN